MAKNIKKKVVDAARWSVVVIAVGVKLYDSVMSLRWYDRDM